MTSTDKLLVKKGILIAMLFFASGVFLVPALSIDASSHWYFLSSIAITIGIMAGIINMIGFAQIAKGDINHD